ncbi:hypothetical protein Tsubulata_048472 [Turnera subulata]|uniref:Uncharacterized protein n=1 Tax=Turnera subulata TaxID=218843 RepID=A0A9Q0GBB1_9ROSI|nr:hypothetical protein Tsubulata_048472 [Turnera subulata]
MTVNSDFLKGFQGSEGFGAVTKHLEHMGSLVLNNPKGFVFSSWLNFGFNDVDFGWGNPVWVGILGEAPSHHLPNFVVFKEAGSYNEIEAWMNLDEGIMSLIEQDPEFLAFATPNPGIQIICCPKSYKVVRRIKVYHFVQFYYEKCEPYKAISYEKCTCLSEKA